jgi:hypothetical protein
MMQAYPPLGQKTSNALTFRHPNNSGRRRGACNSNHHPPLDCLSEYSACKSFSRYVHCSYADRVGCHPTRVRHELCPGDPVPNTALRSRVHRGKPASQTFTSTPSSSAFVIAEAEDFRMRPRDLADAMSSGAASITFTLPIQEARSKAREVINRGSNGRVVSVVENWRSVSDDLIEFTVRNLISAD